MQAHRGKLIINYSELWILQATAMWAWQNMPSAAIVT